MPPGRSSVIIAISGPLFGARGICHFCMYRISAGAPWRVCTGIHYLHVRSIVSQNHGRPAVTIQIQEWESDSCQQSLTQSACDSQLIQKYRRIQYSDGAAGGARARALAGQGREEGAHGGRRCGRAAWNPMLSAHLRIAGDLSYKDHPSLPTPASRGRCARDPSASVKERESGKCLFSLPVYSM